MRMNVKIGAVAVIAAFLLTGLLGFGAAAGSAAKQYAGTLHDAKCYIYMGAQGAKHAKCAQECLQAGTSVVLEDAKGNLWVLVPAKDKESLVKKLSGLVESKVVITGETMTKGGSNFLTVEKVAKSK